MAAALLMVATPIAVAAQSGPGGEATVTIRDDLPGPVYDRHIFGQFAEHLGHGIYGGVWVGERSPIPNIRGYRKDVVDALRAIRVPVIRWPGGCFADEYHWREGIGPRAKRPVKVNTNWGGVTEDNAFGTNEFMNFAELVGAESYVSGDIGSSEPRESAEWVEYMTSPSGSSLAKERAANGRNKPWKLAEFGLGNELWGCGGNMRPEYAADLTRRYATFVKAPGLRKIASGANENDYNWTDTMMRIAGDKIDGIGVHYYTITDTWASKGSATRFDEAAYARTLLNTLKMDEYITGHEHVMDKYDPQKRVALLVDEWGTWHDVEPGTNPGFLYQQNSLRDAIVASLNLDIFARHADRVRGANIAQMVNVLQAMILTDGPRMVLTPTYHVFDMYKDYQDATVLPVDIDSRWYGRDQWVMKVVSASAVRDRSGVVHIGLTNVDPNQPTAVTVKMAGLTGRQVTGHMLTAPAINAVNSFEQPNAVSPVPFSAATIADGVLRVTLPPKSIVMLDVK